MAGFTKLFSSIVDSTVWREPDHVRLVWVTMLAKADRLGVVSASVPGLADAARVSVSQCRGALKRLAAPDPDSRTKAHGGRRIAECEGGWQLLNYVKYRELRNADERRLQTREAVRRYRERHKMAGVSEVSESNHGKPIADAEAEKTKALRSRAKDNDTQPHRPVKAADILKGIPRE